MFLSLNGPQIMTLYYKHFSAMRCVIQQNCWLFGVHILEDAGFMCALVGLCILQFLK
jgi:hypothetical protein